VTHLIEKLGLPGLFVVMTAGNFGVPVGTELVVPTAGAFAGQGHFPSLGPIPAWVIVAIVATLGEVVGGFILYTVGYYGGVPFVQKYGKYVFFREHELERVHAFYERFGANTVFICRFVPFVRGVAAFPAGISRMPKRWFVGYTAMGSAIFCFALAYLGDTAGHNLGSITSTLHTFSLLVIGLLVVAIVIGVVVWQARSRANKSAAKAKSGF
jgi:membrane protein DedA with SNARE-associated domain